MQNIERFKLKHEASVRKFEKEIDKLQRESKRSSRRASLQDASSSARTLKSKLDATQTTDTVESETGGVTMHQLEFSIGNYKPKEISIKVVDQMLCVHAKHEQKKDTKHSCREFRRERLLPQNFDPSFLRASLNKDGNLTVYAFSYN